MGREEGLTGARGKWAVRCSFGTDAYEGGRVGGTSANSRSKGGRSLDGIDNNDNDNN